MDLTLSTTEKVRKMYSQSELRQVFEQITDEQLHAFADTIEVARRLGAPTGMCNIAESLRREELATRRKDRRGQSELNIMQERTSDFGDSEFADAANSDEKP